MIREIGSEFWNVPIADKENRVFPNSTQWYISGRSALNALLYELRGCQTAALPSWCCSSMIKPFLDAGLEVRFYPVYWKDRIIQEIDLDSDVLLLMDYFGYTTLSQSISDYHGFVIRDVTHSIFSASYYDADYYYGSLRKWCGVWTGGFAWTKSNHQLAAGDSDIYNYISLRKKAMELKGNYINRGAEKDKKYLQIYGEAEELLGSINISSAADRDIMVAKKVDVDRIKTQRRANAQVLRKAFPDWLVFHELKDTDCPMFVPIFVPNGKRDELRQYLINNWIYCPIHWPISEYHKLDEKTKTIYQNELSLVCDQRYTEEDMDRMVETIKTFLEA